MVSLVCKDKPLLAIVTCLKVFSLAKTVSAKSRSIILRNYLVLNTQPGQANMYMSALEVQHCTSVLDPGNIELL